MTFWCTAGLVWTGLFVSDWLQARKVSCRHGFNRDFCERNAAWHSVRCCLQENSAQFWPGKVLLVILASEKRRWTVGR